jgi:hypothetical protein
MGPVTFWLHSLYSLLISLYFSFSYLFIFLYTCLRNLCLLFSLLGNLFLKISIWLSLLPHFSLSAAIISFYQCGHPFKHCSSASLKTHWTTSFVIHVVYIPLPFYLSGSVMLTNKTWKMDTAWLSMLNQRKIGCFHLDISQHLLW